MTAWTLLVRVYGCCELFSVNGPATHGQSFPHTDCFLRAPSKSGAGAGVDIVRIERGGEVTYHGPGQLVVYPILDLRGYRQDIHWYMRALEEAVLLALEGAGIDGAAREDSVTGIWIEGAKVAALGVKVRRWVSMHGLAVNVDHRSLDNFGGIVPCGLEGRSVTCINDHLAPGQEALTVQDFAHHMKETGADPAGRNEAEMRKYAPDIM